MRRNDLGGPGHRYGGPWTEVKLDAVVYYLECYTKALSTTPFRLWYIDAFAGSGERTFDRQAGGILEGKPLVTEAQTVDGSARRALAVEPRFHRLVFVERDEERCAALEALRGEHPRRRIEVLRGEANTILQELVVAAPWDDPNSLARGVVFLDPYALQVEWATLEALGRTQLLDVWYLFPLRDIMRQLADRITGIGPKEPKLDRVLGPEWRSLYKRPEVSVPDLLGDVDTEARRNATKRQVESWFKERLETAFAWVSEPLPILTEPGRQAFSLFLCVSNRKASAINLAKHFARYAMRQDGRGASRRRFAP